MENSRNTQKINILDVINVFFRYWLLILISTIIFISVAIVYLKYASKTYSVFARIAFRTERNRTNGASNTYVNVNDLMNQQKTFTNEIAFLRSSPQIMEVVKDLNLFTSYFVKEDMIPKELHFSMINIYKKTPFLVIIDEKTTQPLNTLFYLKIIDDEKFSIFAADYDEVLLYNFKNESVTTQEGFFINGTYKFGENIRNGLCSFKILLNSNYNSAQYQGKDLFFSFNSPQNIVDKFQKAFTIKSAFYESSIADLTFEGDNLELSTDFLSRLINKYIEKNLEKKNHDAVRTIQFIDQQLSNISSSLGKSEQQLQNFQSSRDVLNINEKSSSLNSQMRALEQSRDEIQMRFQYLTRLSDYLEANKDYSTIVAPPMSGMSDATLATLIQELTTLSSERQNLITTNQLKNPRIKTLDSNIQIIKKVISDNIVFSQSATQNELDVINKRITELNKEISGMPQTQRQLIGLEREFNINDAVYTSLLDKRIQANIIMASNLPDCEIIEPVRYVEVASPSPKKIGFIAIFLGLFLPSIYIVIVNFLSPQIRTKDELARFCHLTTIGTIPHNNKEQSNVFTNFPQSPIAERFRSLRSNLAYQFRGEKHKCILVTSTIPGEGKSFTSLNLSLSFASTQNKTLLIGFDLRKIGKTLDELKTADINIGISSYLINAASLEEITMKTNIPNLDFIQNGEIPPDPVGLLSTSKTAELFKTLKSKYDFIIIDTPPFGLVTDAFMLMHFADISLYIIRLGTITKKALRHSMDEIESKKIENIYIVQNDMTDMDRAYNKSYSYKETEKDIFTRFFRRRKKS
jgi:tyrosine-protein kinase Etk/Wzc